MEFTKTKPTDFIRKEVREMQGYVPGKQVNSDSVIKLNTNENPFPVTDKVKQSILSEVEKGTLQKYPDPQSMELREAIARKFNTQADHVMIGNGSDEILSIIFRGILEREDNVVFSRPSYVLYKTLASMVGAQTMEVEVNGDWSQDLEGMLRFASGTAPVGFFTPGAKLSIITNPNTPTGVIEKKDSILHYAYRTATLTLVDEAYMEFADAESVASHAGAIHYPRLMAVGTFSKSHSLAGQRIGWLIAHPDMINELDKVRDSYNVSRLAQVAALAALGDDKTILEQIQIIRENREFLSTELKKMGFTVLESHSNFIFASPPAYVNKPQVPDYPARLYADFLEKNNILVRYFPNSTRVEEFVRITIGKKSEMETVLGKTKEFLDMWKSV